MRTDRRPFVYVLAAIVGVVVAHAGDYLALFPHAHTRDAHLAETGHGYWPVASVSAFAAGILLLAIVVANGWRRERAAVAPARLAVWPLALFQVVLFATIEIVERVPGGLELGSLLRSPELVVGALLQLVVAALVSRLTRTVERAAAALAARSRPSPRRRPIEAGLHPLDGWRHAGTVPATPLGSRAPPALSRA